MNIQKKWKHLTQRAMLDEIKEKSNHQPQVIFKHSTRCGISAHAEDRLSNDEGLEDIADCYYLDLLNYRSISNDIAQIFEIGHQSPQIIVLYKQNVIYTSSHHAIESKKIIAAIEKLG